MKGSLRQRSAGSWELTVDLGRDAVGKRRRRHETVQGTKAVAQRRLRELLSTLDQGMDLPVGKLLVRDWLDRWMTDHVAPNRRLKTRERYADIVEKYLKPHIGQLELSRLGPAHVRTLESRLTAQGLGVPSVRMVHNVLSGAMTHALHMELVTRNPVSQVSPPAHRRPEAIPPAPEAVRALLALAESEQHHLFACIRLVVYTGLRRGEALGLQWDSVDLNDGCIHVVHSLVRTHTQGVILQPPKTESGRRRVDLDQGTIAVLRRHRAAQLELRLRMGPAYIDRGIVFADPLGDWVQPDRLSAAVTRLGGRAGYPGVTVRGLRHFHASVTLQQGQNVVVVSKRLGHSSVSITTDIYAHALPGWQRQAAEAFAQAMG